MDFETFGEHHPARSGILDFLGALPGEFRHHPNLEWATVEEAIDGPPRAPISVPYTMSWADQNRDLGAWLGNDLQRSAFEAAKKVGVLARQANDPTILTDWRKLLTSDHFYYMYISGHGADQGVHRVLLELREPVRCLRELHERHDRPPPPGPRQAGRSDAEVTPVSGSTRVRGDPVRPEERSGPRSGAE